MREESLRLRESENLKVERGSMWGESENPSVPKSKFFDENSIDNSNFVLKFEICALSDGKWPSVNLKN